VEQFLKVDVRIDGMTDLQTYLDTMEFCKTALECPQPAQTRDILRKVHAWALDKWAPPPSIPCAVSEVRDPRPRNRPAFESGQEVDAALRRLLPDLICPCCRRPPPAKQVMDYLPEHLQRDERTIRTHIRRILKETQE
jgi:hypothetical protein